MQSMEGQQNGMTGTRMPRIRASRETDLALQVLRLRYWQHLLNEDLKRGRFKIPIHLAFGHEAVAVALNSVMTDDDKLVLTHRNVAYNLARAGSLDPVLSEYLLQPRGAAGGKMGSMNLTNPPRGVAYTSSILGNNLSVACGIALGKQTMGRAGVVVALMGDGSMEEGAFYEGLVFARSLGLPLVIAVENNDHSLASTIAERRCPIALEDMCRSVGVPFLRLSGNDVFEYADRLCEVRQAAARLVPQCVEALLVTHNQHAGPTPGWPTDPKRISIEDGLVIREGPTDPVHVLRQRLGEAHWIELERQALAGDRGR